MTESLIEALSLLSQGRADILQTYTERNSDRYRYSFRYHHSPAARAIASSLLDHQWLNQQVERALNLHTTDNISKDGLNLFLKTIEKLSIFQSETISIGHKNLLETKILAFQSLLERADKMDQKLKSIEFDYHRDKVLFEREMKKYSSQTNIN